jgi:hypothetical protein
MFGRRPFTCPLRPTTTGEGRGWTTRGRRGLVQGTPVTWAMPVWALHG